MTSKKQLPFYILLGHCNEITEQLGTEQETKVILEDGAWILLKHQKERFIWILDSSLKNLTHHFMMYRNPQILIFFNYHQKGILEHLNEQHRKALTLLRQQPQGKIRIIGFNYSDRRSKLKKLKQSVLNWCNTQSKLKYDEYQPSDTRLKDFFQNWE